MGFRLIYSEQILKWLSSILSCFKNKPTRDSTWSLSLGRQGLDVMISNSRADDAWWIPFVQKPASLCVRAEVSWGFLKQDELKSPKLCDWRTFIKPSAKQVTPVGEENGAGNGCSDCNPVLANATQQPGRSGLRGMRNRRFLLNHFGNSKKWACHRGFWTIEHVAWHLLVEKDVALKEVSMLAWETEKGWKKPLRIFPVALMWKPKPQWPISLPALFWTFVCHRNQKALYSFQMAQTLRGRIYRYICQLSQLC